MKIAIDIREATKEKAGKGYYTAHLVNELLKIDNKNTYILYSDQEIESFKDFSNARVKIIDKKGLWWHFKVLWDAYKQHVDIFFAPTSFIIPAIHNPKKIKVLMTIHDLVAFLFPEKHNRKAVFIERLCLKHALKKVAKVVAVSENTKKDVEKMFNIDKDLVSVIPLSASDVFQPLPKEDLDLFKTENRITDKFILGVGTLEPRKNFETLVKAFAKISRELLNYKLLIVGKKGWYFDTIFETVRSEHVIEKVEFLGYIPERDLVKLYNLASVFVYPSLYEGFGIPPLDAMQSGCPVITSNVASLPEVVGDAAIMVDPNKISELAEAIKKVITNEELRKEMIHKGKLRVKKFSWKTNAENILEIFENRLK